MTLAGAAEGGAGGGGRISVWHQVNSEQRLQLLAGADLKQIATNSFAGIGTLSVTNGAGWAEAIRTANVAAGIVVGKVGTACVSAAELLDALVAAGEQAP